MKISRFPPKTLFSFLVITLLSPAIVEATIVTLPTLSTGWNRDTGPGQPRVETESSYVVDIDDRAGLIPGQAIQITISSPDSFLWVGGFHLGGGHTTISAKANLSLLLGGETVSTNASLFEDFGVVPATGPGVSDPAGFINGPVLPDLVLVVPWDTDLSEATLIFEQDSEITGPGSYFNHSEIGLTGGVVIGDSQLSFNLQSIPEPSGTLLFAVAGMMISFHRRRL